MAAFAQVVACAQTAHQTSVCPVSGDPAAEISTASLATVDGQVITGAQLDPELQAALRDARNEMLQRQMHLTWVGVDEQIDVRLIEAEAQRQGLSPEAFRKQEITDRLPPLSDETVQRFYDENAAAISVPFDVAKEHIRRELLSGEERRLEKELSERLRQGAKIQYTLPVPDLPRFEIDTTHSVAKGSSEARVTVVEFSDFECPYCAEARKVLDQLLAAYPDDVRIVYRDFPLSQHPRAQAAAEAGKCAQEQGKFWPLHDLMYDNPRALSDDDLRAYAGKVELNLEAFEACLASDRPARGVALDEAAARALGVGGTPALFINGIKLIGLLPLPLLKTLVEAELRGS